MSSFLSEDFLLNSETARRLYHEYAEPQPIFDYHTHLGAADIAGDRQFNNLYEIWLEGDHYKWRAMRTFGHNCVVANGALYAAQSSVSGRTWNFGALLASTSC